MKNDRTYLEHILESIELIEQYIKDLSKEGFLSSSKTQDAVVKRIEIIGEAAKNISAFTRRKYPSLPWKGMTGMRDIMVHDYFGIDYEIVWQTCMCDFPDLKQKIQELISKESDLV